MAYHIKSMTHEEFDEYIQIDPSASSVENMLSTLPHTLINEAQKKVAIASKIASLNKESKDRQNQIKQEIAEGGRQDDAGKRLTVDAIKAIAQSDPQVMVLEDSLISLERDQSLQDYRLEALRMAHKSCLALADALLTERINTK
ncbi:MAG: hypothetical protein EBT03_12515 [Betaproteobacteria bacterium]|nr:hypothetical protein [Betaproteobacteria bacterium]